jgi:hypothetical protein
MSEREEVRSEFSFENAIPGGPWYTLDVDKVLDEIVRLRRALAARDAKPTEEMLQRAIAGFMGSFDKSFEDSMYNALKAALNSNQT